MQSRLNLSLLLVGIIVSVGTAFADSSCLNVLSGNQSLATLAANTNNCLVIGDKEFFNFQFIPDANNPSTVTAAGISVSTVGSGTPNDLYGVDFASQLGTLNNLNGAPGSQLFLDYDIKYSVQATGGFMVSDVWQLINGSAITGNPALNPNSGVVVTETATDHAGSGSTASSTVSINPDNIIEPPAQPGDQLILKVGGVPTPVVRADITKDVRLDAAAGDKVTLSLIEQRFSQVPEPRTYALMLGLGLAGLMWKKRATAAV
jgi:hypothetical protein